MSRHHVPHEIVRSGLLDVPSPPFHYNASAWSQRIPICLIAMVGFLMAIYMGLYQWRLIDSAWDPFFSGEGGKNGTETVLDSHESEVMRYWFLVPDAAFGALAYLGDAIFGLAGSTRRWQSRPWLVLIFGFDVIPLGVVSVILVIIQGVSIGSWCFLCLATAAISIVLIYMAYDEVWASIYYLWRVWKKTGDRRILWHAFWGHATPEAAEVAEEMIREVQSRHAAARPTPAGRMAAT